MSDETTGPPHCSRCRMVLGETTTKVSVDSSLLQLTAPELVLCEFCTQSLERWLARKRKSRSTAKRKSRLADWLQRASEPKKELPPWKRGAKMKEKARTRELVMLCVILALVIMLAVVLLTSHAPLPPPSV